MLTPYMAAEFRDLRETGVEDALVVATLEEAMRRKRSTHGAMLSACSIRRRRSMLQRLQSGKNSHQK